MSRNLIISVCWIVLIPLTTLSQRSYKPASVLASGNWYKFSVTNPGIYRIDAAFLQILGIPASGIPSTSIRLFGNGGQMLPEAAGGTYTDDLQENPIQVFDGGDGQFSGSDYFLFYAAGPDGWEKDSVAKAFSHRKNLYADAAFYFITIGGTGLRITTAPAPGSANTAINSYNYRHFYEKDSLNFLASGKQWIGDEFANTPGRTVVRNFTHNIPNYLNSSPLRFSSRCIARSIGANSSFAIRINGTLAQQHILAFTGAGIYDPFARESALTDLVPLASGNLDLQFSFAPGSVNAQGWLDWFELQGRAALSLNGIAQLPFRDWNSVAPGNIGAFTIQQAGSATQVWDITNPLQPRQMNGTLSGSDYRFVNDCSQLREYIAFSGSSFLSAQPIGRINNQNLHATAAADLLIIAPASLKTQAQQLADYHIQRDNLRSTVVTTEEVYHEFASGTPDPTALRDFVKMLYDRAAGNPAQRPKYLLLLGDASFDYKNRINNNTNLVPAYESLSSLDPLTTYVSDDYFGFLDDNEDINSPIVLNLLDVGIGRIPARNPTEAKHIIDKILNYHSAASLGPWRNQFSFIADDEDGNLHLEDAEVITTTAAATAPVFNQNKIYLDAFRQESGSGGSRYPAVNEAINNQVFSGTLIWNYSGHGGARRLAEETVLDQEIVNGWNNANKLPLFITATCDFAPYDNPTLQSIGENILLREKTGGIALMTTTRVVFAFSNRVMNNNYLRFALQPDGNGRYPSLGAAVQAAKNFTYQTFGDINNNRKFTLLGDPALTLGFPALKVRTTAINNVATGAVPDTLKALNKYTISGVVTDAAGNTLNNFNGTIYPAVYDKVQQVTTLGNDPGSTPVNFASQNNILYKGKARVSNGAFSFTFIVPKDINYQFGNGRLSYYADNAQAEGNGLLTNVIIGGAGNGVAGDGEGPRIRAFLNDERFVDGGLVNPAPVLILRLSDSSGINTVGAGIGHDITATLDGDNRKVFVLNEFYEAELDSYQRGLVRFQLPALAEGMHTLTIKAWDVVNNSSEYTLRFRVANTDPLQLDHVLNYPNPFTTRTSFWFEHNRPGEDLSVHLQVFTISGRLVKSIKRTINTPGNRSTELEWDGKDDFGSRLGRGVYVYRLSVRTADGRQAEQFQKLVLF